MSSRTGAARRANALWIGVFVLTASEAAGETVFPNPVDTLVVASGEGLTADADAEGGFDAVGFDLDGDGVDDFTLGEEIGGSVIVDPPLIDDARNGLGFDEGPIPLASGPGDGEGVGFLSSASTPFDPGFDGPPTELSAFSDAGASDGWTPAPFRSGGVLTDESGFAVPLNVGDVVSDDLETERVIAFSDDASERFFAPFSLLYEGDAGPLADEGGSVIVGLRLAFFDEPVIALDDEVSQPGGSATFFGWAEIERGSLELKRVGFQSVAGVGAPITPVPLPPALALLATGLAGLAALGRRRGGA